jgi:hypothetical protein
MLYSFVPLVLSECIACPYQRSMILPRLHTYYVFFYFVIFVLKYIFIFDLDILSHKKYGKFNISCVGKILFL